MSLVEDSWIDVCEETEAENESYYAFKKELSQIGKNLVTEVDMLDDYNNFEINPTQPESEVAGSLPQGDIYELNDLSFKSDVTDENPETSGDEENFSLKANTSIKMTIGAVELPEKPPTEAEFQGLTTVQQYNKTREHLLPTLSEIYSIQDSTSILENELYGLLRDDEYGLRVFDWYTLLTDKEVL